MCTSSFPFHSSPTLFKINGVYSAFLKKQKYNRVISKHQVSNDEVYKILEMSSSCILTNRFYKSLILITEFCPELLASPVQNKASP